MRADLHIHSFWSDGALPPNELAIRARHAGVALLSITDHDNLGGLEEKERAAKLLGLAYISGWEVSAYERDCKVHVLGYGCRAGDAYHAFLEERKRGAVVRAKDMIRKANAHFRLALTVEDAEREHRKKETPLHTMNVVAAYAKRLGREGGELYREAFAIGKPAYSGLCRPSPEEAIDVIHASGGIAVLAHPARIRLPLGAQNALIGRLIAHGLDGIECYYTGHSAEETARFLALARERGLYVTGGSDFHETDGTHFIGQPPFEPDGRLLERLL